jgi:hypothetical protein
MSRRGPSFDGACNPFGSALAALGPLVRVLLLLTFHGIRAHCFFVSAREREGVLEHLCSSSVPRITAQKNSFSVSQFPPMHLETAPCLPGRGVAAEGGRLVCCVVARVGVQLQSVGEQRASWGPAGVWCGGGVGACTCTCAGEGRELPQGPGSQAGNGETVSASAPFAIHWRPKPTAPLERLIVAFSEQQSHHPLLIYHPHT